MAKIKYRNLYTGFLKVGFIMQKSTKYKESEELKMITLNKYGDKCNRVYLELYGLSTDTKPIEKFENVFIGNASTYYEMDSKKLFIYDEENHKWFEM